MSIRHSCCDTLYVEPHADNCPNKMAVEAVEAAMSDAPSGGLTLEGLEELLQEAHQRSSCGRTYGFDARILLELLNAVLSPTGHPLASRASVGQLGPINEAAVLRAYDEDAPDREAVTSVAYREARGGLQEFPTLRVRIECILSDYLLKTMTHERTVELLLGLCMPDREAIAAEKLRAKLTSIQLEHETPYKQTCSTNWRWSCKCGQSCNFADWDSCHIHTREHWADVVLATVGRYKLAAPDVELAVTSALERAAIAVEQEADKVPGCDSDWPRRLANVVRRK